MTFSKGDRVRFSEAMLEQYSPGRRPRAEVRRGVINSTPRPDSPYVWVLWHVDKNPVQYHASLIEHVEPDNINWNEIRSSVKRQFEKTLEYLGEGGAD